MDNYDNIDYEAIEAELDKIFSPAELIMLPVEDIYSHPDNPRKDLGDLTELAESIKAQGILQNLTVIRGHALTKSN